MQVVSINIHPAVYSLQPMQAKMLNTHGRVPKSSMGTVRRRPKNRWEIPLQGQSSRKKRKSQISRSQRRLVWANARHWNSLSAPTTIGNSAATRLKVKTCFQMLQTTRTMIESKLICTFESTLKYSDAHDGNLEPKSKSGPAPKRIRKMKPNEIVFSAAQPVEFKSRDQVVLIRNPNGSGL